MNFQTFCLILYFSFPPQANIFGIILNSWLSRTPTYISLLKSIVNITLNVFATICRELLPTPDKSHYTYNLRDLSKVFQGILMADPTKINVSNSICKEIRFDYNNS